MKKLILITILILPGNTLISQPNRGVSEDQVRSFIENYYKTIAGQDMDALGNMLADNGLFCGTDPTEYWDKEAIVEMFRQSASGDAPDMSEMLKKRVINVAGNGMSAIIVEQLDMPWSPNLPVRQTLHLVRLGERWAIDFIGWSFMAANEDIAKLNEAAGQ
jgi:ketosteroid isomerase-like protein